MALVYNIDVSDVIVHVAEEDDVAAVEQALQDMITDWTRTTHPKYSREAVPPVYVRPLTDGEHNVNSGIHGIHVHYN